MAATAQIPTRKLQIKGMQKTPGPVTACAIQRVPRKEKHETVAMQKLS